MITRKVAPALAAGCTVVIKPAEATPLFGARAGRARASAPASRRACSTSSPARPRSDRRRDVRQPDGAQALVHRLDRSRPHAHGAGRADTSRSSRSSSAATRLSSCSTTPISTPRSKARSPRSTATRARPACAPTACSCRTSVYDAFAAKLAERRGRLKVGAGTEPGRRRSGPLIDERRSKKVEEHVADAVAKGAQVMRSAESGMRSAAPSSSPPCSPT